MRKILTPALIVILFSFTSTYAESEWENTFGGPSTDYAESVQQTTDGGYIIAGETSSYGGPYDIWLFKADAGGNKLWEKTFGGTSSEYGRNVQQTVDGGYIIAGQTYSPETSDDALAIKTDANGKMVWHRTYGGSKSDSAWSVQQTRDGGYVIAGSTCSYGSGYDDAWLIKTDANGNMLWDKTFGGPYSDYAESVQQTKDGGYIIAGYISPSIPGYGDAWLIRTDASGNMLWEKVFGGSYGDSARSVQQTTDGGYILVGSTSSYGAGNYDAWLIKTDADGNELWDRTFGSSQDDTARSVEQTADAGYIIAGRTYSFIAASNEAWLIKTDYNGERLWEETYGGSLSDEARSARQTADGGYILAGATHSYETGDDALLLKTYGGDPAPDIQANGQDGPVFAPIHTAVSLSIALDPREYVGKEADWWLVAVTPTGTCSFVSDQSGGHWVAGIQRAAQAGLVVVPELTVSSQELTRRGNYTFYFGVDTFLNGILDNPRYDSVQVKVY